MSLVQLLVASVILVPAPRNKPEGWTGQIVMLKRSGIPYRPVQAPPDGALGEGSLLMIEYRVMQDKGTELVLVENGKEVVVNKGDTVLQSEAVVYYTEVLEKEPNSAYVHAFRGWAHKQAKNYESALKDYGRAIELAPNQCAWRNNRALIWIEKKDYDKAIADYDESIRIFPQYGLAYRNRAGCRIKKKEYAKAKEDLEKSIEIAPEVPYAYNTLARLLATCPDAKVRDGKRALEIAKKANGMMAGVNGAFLDTLAAAHAENGDFDEAVKVMQKAFADPYFATEKDKADEARQRLQLYRDKKPFRDEGKE